MPNLCFRGGIRQQKSNISVKTFAYIIIFQLLCSRQINIIKDMAVIVGRKREQEELNRLYERKQAQLIAVYGRRRVGKTFLIRETFKNRFTFYHTGLSPLELTGENLLEAQLRAFRASLSNYGIEVDHRLADWMEAFQLLRRLIERQPDNQRQVVFIDEMPWMDTPRSGFVTAFESFWNGWGSGQDNLMLIVCGSASSWIKDKLVNTTGGLYNRVDIDIQLEPFSLFESEQLLLQNDVTLSRYDLMEVYMAVGGIPYYLNQLLPGLSAAEQIDRLVFDRKAKLTDEFDKLFNSTFANAEANKRVVQYLSTRHSGYSRDEISKRIGVQGQELTRLLRGLEAGDFIQKYQPFGCNARQLQYRLVDHFCWFWLRQVEGKNRGPHYWQDNSTSTSTRVWRGIAFEELCLSHIDQLKSALGIAAVATQSSAWSVPATEQQHGSQIDLIITRKDNMVHLCEMKCYEDFYQVDNEEEMKMRHRMAMLRSQISPRQSVQTTLVTTFGLTPGKHSGIFSRVVVLDDLFLP